MINNKNEVELRLEGMRTIYRPLTRRQPRLVANEEVKVFFRMKSEKAVRLDDMLVEIWICLRNESVKF